jgi:2,3-bisphosphoglycerate-independent phosphoglycerate mutase
MKKIFLILDGMADRKQSKLGNKTPLEFANMQNLDRIYQKSLSGCVRTIPEGEETGSAVANLNLLGFETKKVYKGRAVIEASGAKLPIDKNSLYIRCNFITLKGEYYEDSIIESYSAHEIETKDALPLVKRLNDAIFGGDFELKSTGSFRNVLECKGKTDLLGKLNFMPPHDMIGKRISDYMDISHDSKVYFDFLKDAYTHLQKHNHTKANAIWFWGVSKMPELKKNASEKTHVLCETILMKGIANLMGATKTVTDESNGFLAFLEAKKNNAIKAVKADNDFIYVHIQAPDDLSHELLIKEKAEALSLIDQHFLDGFIKGIAGVDYALVVASDHYTFSDDGSHGDEPAPFILYKNNDEKISKFVHFTEQNCRDSGFVISANDLHDLV